MTGEFLIFSIIVLIFSVIVHEVAHGATANWLGDPTAKFAGRLTLNPLKHLDPVGSVFLPLFLILIRSPVLFGWARPVPYNPNNLRNQRWGPALVGGAGPLSNIFLAGAFALLIRSDFFSFNLGQFFAYIVFINLILAVFNLLPIPPLDGSKLLFALLPAGTLEFQARFERYGFLLLLFVIFFGLQLVFAIANFLFNLFVGQNILQFLSLTLGADFC